MTYAARTASYREMEVLSASPARLVVMLFDHLVVQLHRAKMAVDRDDVSLRTQSLGKARAIVSELLSTLNFEQGGAIALELSGIYNYMLEEMVDVGMRRDAIRIGKLAAIATELRDGFSGAAELQGDIKRSA